MNNSQFELFRFKRFTDLWGTAVTPSFGRRNGRALAFLNPAHADSPQLPVDSADMRDDSRFFVNLNAVERATWRKILSAQSISSIAEEEGVSRSAIYTRIRGNRWGQGGMIGKNFWVLLWWRLRRRIVAGAQ
jgi:hypothetical protein